MKRAQALVDIEKTEKTKILVHADKLAAGVNELASTQKQMANSAKGDYKTGKRPPPANAFGNIFPNQVVARKYNILRIRAKAFLANQ